MTWLLVKIITTPLWKKGGGELSGFRLAVISSARHNFISAQYLENKLIEFHQILRHCVVVLEQDTFILA